MYKYVSKTLFLFPVKTYANVQESSNKRKLNFRVGELTKVIITHNIQTDILWVELDLENPPLDAQFTTSKVEGGQSLLELYWRPTSSDYNESLNSGLM